MQTTSQITSAAANSVMSSIDNYTSKILEKMDMSMYNFK